MTPTLFLSFAGAGALTVFLLAFLVGRRTVRIRRRRAVEAELATDALPAAKPAQGRPVLAQAVATQVSTRCDGHEMLGAPAERHLSVTEEGLTADGPSGWHLSHSRVIEAVFVARHDRWASGQAGVLLRVSWRQAGRTVAALLFVHGCRREGERLRKELHLRAGSARPFGRP
ncbi:MAG: hypothetical protein RL199_2120 [Pseudomonadota bacterium]|jgi:hypothetical protein